MGNKRINSRTYRDKNYVTRGTQRVFDSVVSNRIERIEFLDEVDLLHQLLSHYCIAWAVNDAAQLGE